MKALSIPLLLIAAVLQLQTHALAHALISNPPTTRHPRPTTNTGISTTSHVLLRGGAENMDYAGEAAGLFSNIRIPAALFAGASAGAAFALPIGMNEPLKIATVKRVYALMMMGALSSEIVAVVVSTLTMGALSTQTKPYYTAPSLREYLRDHLDLEWVSARIHFLGGVLLFSLATGLRAWISIACPVVAKAALGIILSSTVLCLSFLAQLEGGTFSDGFFKLPLRYAKALVKRSKHSKMFAASFVCSLATMFYIIGSVPHVYMYLLTH